jgi:large subunit ribosomal protein L15
MGHEGGQMPIQRRVPKRGFKNNNRIEFKVFNLGQIDQLVEKYGFTEFSLENLYINGLISRTDRVKVLANGELKAKLTFKVNAASDKAKAAVEASGGTLEIVK